MRPMNNTTSPILGAFLAALLSLSLCARAQAQAPQYAVTILGPLSSENASSGHGISPSGLVVGYSNNSSDYAQAVLWNGASPTVLGGVGGNISVANGINAFGQVAGFATVAGDSVSDAVVWNGTTPTVLGGLGGTSAAVSINASGQVAGYSSLADNSASHAVRWNGTTPTDLGTAGGTNSYGNGINNSGEVAGFTTGNGGYHAVVWNGTTPTVLDGLGGTNSQTQGINASGQVAGYSQITGDSAWHAVVWNGTTPTDLGTLGGTDSFAEGINDFGQVIGVSELTGDQNSDAFLYTGSTMYDLNDLLLPGSGVTNLYLDNGTNGINNVGQIAAYGTVNGVQEAVLLTPTPEPSATMLMLVSGAIWFASKRRLSAR